jgi:hypothetical protein
MPRPDRDFAEGGAYHVYNRIGRGERVFDGAEEATGFVELPRRVISRDGLTIYAWCLMRNHSGSLQRRSRRPLAACRTRWRGESGAGRMMSTSGSRAGYHNVTMSGLPGRSPQPRVKLERARLRLWLRRDKPDFAVTSRTSP